MNIFLGTHFQCLEKSSLCCRCNATRPLTRIKSRHHVASRRRESALDVHSRFRSTALKQP